MPAISACLARSSGSTAVTIAYELEGGAVAVRLRDRDGGRYECEAPADGSAPTGLDPIGDRNVLPGEREPTFYPTPDSGPSGQCYMSQPAIGADGAVLGALVRRMC
jgi:putative lipoprotein